MTSIFPSPTSRGDALATSSGTPYRLRLAVWGWDFFVGSVYESAQH